MPRRAKGIAAPLSQPGAWVDKSLVNSVLIREGSAQFSYDRATFTYRLAGAATSDAATPTTEVTATHDRSAVLTTARRLLADGKPHTAREITMALHERGMAGLEKSAVNSVWLGRARASSSTTRLRTATVCLEPSALKSYAR